jgi:choline dehydrogenase
VVLDLPGVGENLQDHLQIRLSFECSKPITTNDQLNSWIGTTKLGLEWLLYRSGPLAVGINQGGCFMRALKHADGRPVASTPDIQFHVSTLSADMAGGKVHPLGLHHVGVSVAPESRGHVRIRSRDPFAPPSMQPNYLSTELDRRTNVAAVRAARQIAQLGHGALRQARSQARPSMQSDEELLEFCRDNGATIFHPSGTCAWARPEAHVRRRCACACTASRVCVWSIARSCRLWSRATPTPPS